MPSTNGNHKNRPIGGTTKLLLVYFYYIKCLERYAFTNTKTKKAKFETWDHLQEADLLQYIKKG